MLLQEVDVDVDVLMLLLLLLHNAHIMLTADLLCHM
jgi:hypothetical protein